MISIYSLWESVRDLTRKDNAGWTDMDEFSRLVNNAQQDLFDYYIAEEFSRAKSALQIFIKEATLSQSLPSYYNLPSDYRYPLVSGAVVIQSADCTPSIDNYPADHLDSDEALLVLRSPIRKPDLAKRRFAFEILTDKIKAYPKEFKGRWYLKYYRNPTAAVLNYTLDTVNQLQTYNPVGTVNLEWPENERQNFIDLILVYKGALLDKPGLVNWAMAKKSLNQKNTNV